MNLKKSTALSLFISASLPLLALAAGEHTISIAPVYSNTDITTFLANVLGRLQSIVGFLAVLFILIGAVLYVSSAGSEKMTRAAKGFWTSALLGVAIVFAAPSFLLQIKTSLFSGAMPTSPDQIPSLTDMVSRVLQFLLSIVGSLAIIGLVISGIMYITAGLNKGQSDQAKKAMQSSIIGIILAGLALALIKQIAEFIK